jgi:uncharacterized protein (TIGR02246 family)
MSNEDPFLRLLTLYKAAVLAKDTGAFLALYSPDLHVFDMWGNWSLRGIESWRAMADQWFSSLGTEKVVVTFDEVESTIAGDLAIGHAILTFTAISAEGERVRSLSNRITVGLRKVDGCWKVFHEHTSAPIEHESTKALLHRVDMRVTN